jgi:hypothetical protein
MILKICNQYLKIFLWKQLSSEKEIKKGKSLTEMKQIMQ